MTCERITVDTEGASRAGHEFRYRLAAGFLQPGDTVLDAACGIGYGATFAPDGVEWVGVDIAPVVDPAFEHHGRWVTADLCVWQPDCEFDVAVSFETLEHVTDPDAVIGLLCQARRLILCSVPIVPTAGANPFHLHDFEVGDLPRMFGEHGWRLHQCILQPAELAAVYVFEP